MPKAYKALFTVGGGDLSTPTGYLNTELMSLMAPLLVLLYAITAGANGIAGEEDRHTAPRPVRRPALAAGRGVQPVAALPDQPGEPGTGSPAQLDTGPAAIVLPSPASQRPGPEWLPPSGQRSAGGTTRGRCSRSRAGHGH
jgi:hypothetical protein